MKILSVQRHTAAHGGGELVAAWILEALKDENELTVYSWRPPDYEHLNRLYGTSIREGEIGFLRASRALGLLYDLAHASGLDRSGFQKFAALMRLSRRLPQTYDVVISPLDEFDFGVVGMQYIHYPWSARAIGAPLTRNSRRTRPWMWIAGMSAERLRANHTIANSTFTAAAVREQMGIEAEVILPPCPGEFADTPWDSRTDTVAMVGRLVPVKRFGVAIEAIRRARELGADLRLRVIGSSFGVSRAELRGVRSQLASEPWIEVHENVGRDELSALISECRYGIHAFGEEPYGIAVAEMVRAGCIPVVVADGGPPEIVGGDARLQFRTPPEAADRLFALHRSPELRDEVRARLRDRAALLEPGAFMRAIRASVEEFAARGGER